MMGNSDLAADGVEVEKVRRDLSLKNELKLTLV
jgi:hypothetical protein